MDITTLTKLATPILIIIVYIVNLIKGMQYDKLENGIIKSRSSKIRHRICLNPYYIIQYPIS